MDTKIYLDAYVKLVLAIYDREDQIQRIREKAEKETASYTPAKTGASEQRPMANLMELVADMESELDEKRKLKQNVSVIIIASIMELEDRNQRTALLEKYMNMHLVQEIAEIMEVSVKSVYRYISEGKELLLIPEGSIFPENF